MTYTSSLLNRDKCDHLDEILCKNKDIFVLIHLDILGIDLVMVSHKLNILPTTQPIR